VDLRKSSNHNQSERERPLTISAVLPAYNEEANLETTVSDLLTPLRQHSAAFEIIIVDDGSTDQTAQRAQALAPRVGELQLLRHGRNLGYGWALRTGFAAARMDWILLLDSDGQFDPTDLGRLVAAADGAEMVLGYRFKRADPSHRRLFARAWAWLMRILLGVGARDVDCAFKLMRRSLVQSIELQATGAFVSAELLARAARRGARIVEVPVTHRPRRFGEQTGSRPRVLIRAFYELFRLWWRVRRDAPGARRARPGTEA
jgi:glycosyltransferase involved in cell wall biosynthesis